MRLFQGHLTFVAVVTLLTCAPPLQGAPDPELVAYHRARVASEEAKLAELCRRGDAYHLYTTSFAENGILSAAEGLRDEALLQVAIRLQRAKVGSAGTDHRGARVWANRGETGVEEIMLFQAVTPVARTAAVIRENPAWRDRYADDARAFVDFADRVVRAFFPERVPYLAGRVWTDKSSHAGMIATYLYRATADEGRRAVYRRLAEGVGAAFKDRLRESNGGWIWDDGAVDMKQDKRITVPQHDTSHANREPMMMLAMYEAGLVFTRADLERMAGTVVDTLWNRGTTPETVAFANYLNGSTAAYRDGRARTGYDVGTMRDGWPMMGRFDPRVQAVMRTTMRAVMAGDERPHKLGRYNYGTSVEIGLSGVLIHNDAVLGPNGDGEPAKGINQPK